VRVTSIAIAIAIIAGSMAGAASVLFKTTAQLGATAGPVPGVEITRIPLGNVGTDLQFGEGAVWLMAHDTVYRVDAVTNRLTRVHIDGEAKWMAVGEGGVWVSVCTSLPDTGRCPGSVIRIDPQSLRVVATIHLPDSVEEPFSMATGLGGVWILADAPHQLFEIDPNTNSIHTALPAPSQTLLLGASLGSVWLGMGEGKGILRVDPGSGRIHTIVGTSPVAIAITPNAVFGSDPISLVSGTLKKIDPHTNRVVATLDVANRYWVAAGEHGVWLAGAVPQGTEMLRVDPLTMRPVGSRIVIPVNRSSQGFGYVGPGLPIPWVVTGAGSVWVFRFADGEIDRVTPPGGA